MVTTTTHGSKRSQELQAFAVDCEGGLILDETIFHVDPGTASVLKNYEPSIQDGYQRILGFTKYSTSEITATGYTSGKILGLSIGGGKVLACRGDAVVFGTGTTWTELAGQTAGGAARTSAGKYMFDVYTWTGNIQIILCDDGGSNAAALYDTTSNSYTLLNGAIGSGSGTAPTAPRDVKQFNQHMWYAQGNTITFSAPFSENNFLPGDGSGSFTIPDAAGLVLGLKPRREKLYIFCENQIHVITGSSIQDFDLNVVTENIGCVDPWSIQEFHADIIFLATDGLRLIKGTDQEDDTTSINLVSKQIQSLLNGLHKDTHDISSFVIRSKSQYRMFYPTSSGTVGTSPGIMAVHRRQHKKSTVDASSSDIEFGEIIGIKPSYSVSSYESGIELFLHGDYSNGLIYKQESGNTFDGTNMTARFRTPDMIMGDIGISKVIHRIILDILRTGTTTINTTVIYDINSGLTPQPDVYTIIPQVTAVSLYGTAVYGTDTYDTDTFVLVRQSVEGSGFTVAIEFVENQGSAQFTIRGFQLEHKIGGRR